MVSRDASAPSVAALDLGRLARTYDARVPRYTSYPTAPHFSDHVTEAVYRAWLAELQPATPLSLYLHVPFCDSMCWFCGCYTKIVAHYQPVRDYLDVLQQEVALVATALPARSEVRHVHIGGGSPSLLEAPDWQRLMTTLRDNFDLAANAEVAIELDPRDTTEAYIAQLGASGVTRVSIGVQDFDPVVQAAINRHQPFDVVARVCGWLRGHGLERINLDLMYGLPHQTTERVVAMVDQALSLRPARVALFGYAHVPWMKSHQKLIPEAVLPDAEARLRQLTAAAARLEAAGYWAVGLDHFARADDDLALALATGTLRRNFQGYTTDDAAVLIGLGASAIGSLPRGYAQNLAPLRPYAEAIAAGRLPIARGRELTAEDRLRRDIIERLMCQLTVDLDAVGRDHPAGAIDFHDPIARLSPLVADDLVRIEGHRIMVTEAGRPFVRLAAAAFDAYLAPGAGRHSRAL